MSNKKFTGERTGRPREDAINSESTEDGGGRMVGGGWWGEDGG